MDLARRVGSLLQARGWTLSVAESSTGGLLGHLITQIPGSSAYFMGGVIAYDNAIKGKLLNVHKESLERWGAVSAAVALEMALGAQQCLNTDAALSITGIAGPTGGTAQKPVGLAYIGLAVPGERWVWRFVARVTTPRSISNGARDANNQAFAQEALQYLIAYLAPESH